MSLRPEPVGPVPEETARVARASFPKGNTYMQLRDVLGVVYDDASFAPLFATRGRPAEAPWRLALVTVLQFAEGLSDRQAAEAVRARIDWKYALGLELTDSGFDFSVLSEFRARLIAGSAEQSLLDALLDHCKAGGYLRARGRQRTDSTHVLAALRVLNRLERVGETMRLALNVLATVAPDWLRVLAPADWYERYGRRIEDYRLPRGAAARQAYAGAIGADGVRLLAALDAASAPSDLRTLPEIRLLRTVWAAEYATVGDGVRWRDATELPPTAEQVESPYESEARYGAKRGMEWIGYKAHLTETCDDDLPHLVTHVETTIATAADVEQLAAVHRGLARAHLLPAQHLVDAGYVRAHNLVASRDEFRVDLVGPIAEDHQWQAKAEQGFALAHFQIDWEARRVTCPRGRASARWCPTRTARGPMIHVDFSAQDCAPCPARPLCTRAKAQPRSLTLHPRREHEATEAARRRQATAEFVGAYARRAGVEGTLSQAVRACGLRRARYRGLHKTHLQHIATAAALDLYRLADWLNGRQPATTRRSRFAALARTK